jgi:hypothetical protein
MDILNHNQQQLSNGKTKFEKIENLRTKIKFLKNFEDKIYIYIYIYSAINLVNNGKQLMMAHA